MSLASTDTNELKQQLAELEDLYAEQLADDLDAKALSRLWEMIKKLRQQLQLPIYDHSTPPDQRY
jgi:hypothetical protein